MINPIVYRFIKQAANTNTPSGPFGYPYLQPSSEGINPRLKRTLREEKMFEKYIVKALSGVDMDRYAYYNTPENARAKKLFKSLAKKFPKL